MEVEGGTEEERRRNDREEEETREARERRRRSDVIKMSVIKAAVMSWRIKEQKMEH